MCKDTAAVNTVKAQVQPVSTKERKHNNFVAPKSAPSLAGNGARPPQQQSRFTVQVNGQVFIGQSSVTLTRRVLSVDGKPVAQSKLAVVIGQPKTMQADGTVTSSGERSVLISK